MAVIHLIGAQKRQDLGTGPTANPNGEVFIDDGDVPFWWTRTGQIIRWSIFFGIILFIILFFTLGNLHAKRRIRKGLVPLRYHRWMLNRGTRARYDPAYQNPSVYYNTYPPTGQYGMQPMAAPAYDPSAPRPPMYQPPAGGTKVDPAQSTNRPGSSGEPRYNPPMGAPPPAVQANHTGRSVESNNPYRL